MLGRTVAAGACAVLLVGCGSSSSSSSPASPASSGSSGSGAASQNGLSLTVTGGTGNLNATECAKQAAFEHYNVPANVTYSGTVSPVPSGRWKVKLKLKQCKGSSFVDANSEKIVGQSNGQFSGVFVISEAGVYSLRATLESGKRPQSPKVYLRVG